MTSSGINKTQALLQSALHIFALLGILFIPIHVYPFQDEIVHLLFRTPLAYFAQHVCGFALIDPDISSDSTLMYLLLAFLLLLSLLISIFLPLSGMWHFHREHVLSLIRKALCFYLALQLSEYGADKIFKGQFYLPEPNILYTPFGKLDQDILFWSWMGTSYSYNLFLGCLELCTATLLLFKRTRTLGLLLSIGIMGYVTVLDFCFDISVKLFSLFLLFLAWLLIFPHLKILYRFLILKENAQLSDEPVFPFFKTNKGLKSVIKILLVCYILVSPAYPYLASGNLNDDMVRRPFLHGAYEVIEMKSPDPPAAEISPIKRFFIHRDNYIIFQDKEDNMHDFKLWIDSARQEFVVTDYYGNKSRHHFTYSEKDSLLLLNYRPGSKTYLLKAKAINWRELPALQRSFHWTSDSY